MATAAMAVLTGTEKEVEWAESIRAEAIEAAEAAMADAEGSVDLSDPKMAAKMEAGREALATMRRATDAAWWISASRRIGPVAAWMDPEDNKITIGCDWLEQAAGRRI
jgi:hypothetical protein